MRNRFLLALLLLGSILSCSQTEALRAIKKADELRGLNSYPEAIRAYQQIIKKYPGDKEIKKVYLSLAQLYRQGGGKDDGSIQVYRDLIAAWPLSEEAWIAHRRLADIYQANSEYDFAIMELTTALKHFPEHAERRAIQYRVGQLYLEVYNYAQAIQEWEVLAQDGEAPPNIRARALLGVGEALWADQKPKEAYKYFEKFIEEYPDNSMLITAQLGMISCREEENDLKGAYKLLEKFLEEKSHPALLKRREQLLERLSQVTQRVSEEE